MQQSMEECLTPLLQVGNPNQQPPEHTTGTKASAGGINAHHPEGPLASPEVGHISDESMEDLGFTVQLTDALAGVIHLQSIVHRHMFSCPDVFFKT